MLGGTNLEIYKRLSEIDGLDIVASGGITYENEIKTLRDMNIYGAILGNDVYEGILDLSRIIEIAGGAISLRTELFPALTSATVA